MKVEHWGPGLHITLPERSLHHACADVGITLTRAEAVELHRLLVEALWNQGSPPTGSDEGSDG